MNKPTDIYWLVEPPADQALKKLCDDDARRRKDVADFLKDIGAGDGVLRCGNQIIGVTLEKPDERIWKRHKGAISGYWSPRRNTPKGKEVAKRMYGLRITNGGDVGAAFLGSEMAFVGRGVVRPGMEFVGDKCVITADESPAWKPIPGLRQIKASEYWAMKEANQLENQPAAGATVE